MLRNLKQDCNSEEKYNFTKNWFNPSEPQWQNLIQTEGFPKKAVKILEIGAFEGRSSCWILDNLCEHPESSLTSIDSFDVCLEDLVEVGKPVVDISDIQSRFLSNIKASGRQDQFRLLKGLSSVKLAELNRNLAQEQFDLVYVDGSHKAENVLEDAVLAWPLVKEGGILIFDDYGQKCWQEEINNPALGIDSFLRCFANSIEILNINYQVTIRKVKKQRFYNLNPTYVNYY